MPTRRKKRARELSRTNTPPKQLSTVEVFRPWGPPVWSWDGSVLWQPYALFRGHPSVARSFLFYEAPVDVWMAPFVKGRDRIELARRATPEEFDAIVEAEFQNMKARWKRWRILV